MITTVLFDLDGTLLPFEQDLAQPTHVAEKFTGIPGIYVPLTETIKGFQAIISGDMDKYPETAFYNVGTIDDVVEKAAKL